MEIRTATPADAEQVREVMQRVYVGDGWADPARSPAYVASLLDVATRIAEADVFLAARGGRILGTVTATDGPLANVAQPGELEVRMLAVLTEARRTGVARALMATCEDLARSRGCHRVVLSTDPRMIAAQRLYASLGYVRTPERDWPIDGTVLLTYGKELGGRQG